MLTQDCVLAKFNRPYGTPKRIRHSRKPPLSVVFITLREPQAHGDTAEGVRFVKQSLPQDFIRRIASHAFMIRKTSQLQLKRLLK
jgi:hypothetical protein